MYATSGDNRVAIRINTPALGDTIAAIPTLRKLSQAYGDKRLTVFSSKPFLFEGHPLVSEAKDLSESTEGYKVYNTFNQLVGKSYQLDGENVEFRYSNMDLRQFHAVSLGFTLTEAEMEMDLYIERERKLPFEDYVIIHPTHTWPTRTWAREKWQALVDKLNQAGIPVVAVGRDSKETGNYNTEKPVMDINIKLGLNLLNDPDNDPAELRWMMNNQARAVVTMDSGILHLAGTTDVNIIQLSSSIDYRLRAPYRHGSQAYKYRYVDGGCEMCSSDMASNIKVHGSIHGVPPQIKCLKDKHFDECHPTVEQVYNEVISLESKEDNMQETDSIERQIIDMQTYVSTINSLNITPKTVLEIGSRDGHHAEALRRAFNINDGDVYVVDANPKQHKRITSNYPGFNFIGNAISDKKGTLDFYQINTGDEDWDGISGLLDRPELYNQEFTNTKKIEVESITGKELLDSIERDIDICKIDVEGLTYEVLQSFGQDLDRIKTLHIETEQREVWSGQKLDSDVKALLESRGFVKLHNKTQNTKWGEQYDQIWAQEGLLKSENESLHERAFVTHCDENYIPIVEKMIESVKLFSDLPVIAYVLNSSVQVKGADKTIRLDFTVRDGDQFLEGDQFINRKSHKVYDIITKKVDVLEHALQNIAEHIVYLDGDSVATNNIESLFNYTNQQHPMFTQGINEVMLMDGVGNPFDAAKPDLSKTLEYPLCELLDIEQEHHHRFPMGYVQTGYISAIKSNLPFIKEWKMLCEMDEVKSNPNKYAPFHEETIVNVLLWKYNYKERMPLVYVNAQNAERVRETYAAEFNTTQKVTHKGPWFALPPKVEDIAAFHGAKDAKEIDKMIETIKGQKKKIVYLTPHLSTGGMPQFVLTRLEALIEQDHYDVHLIEYNQYSATYTVQRDKIVELLGSNFHTVAYLGELTHEERGTRVKELLEELNPTVVHLDECPESFDDFNRMDIAFTDWLYSHQRPWHIVETCHNIWFNGDKKKWQPDAYAFCSPHHPGNNFKDNPGYKEVIEYPITNARPEAHQKLAAKEQLEMDPNKVHILNVGLWTQGKNQSEGVNIARIINEIFPGKYQFHFVGNQAGNFKEYWQPILEDLPENVKVWGERNDTHLFYQAADAFMFNSTWECNPLAVREAIGHGLITFTRNLPQYLDMFTPYIVPLENDLSENANIILSHLESAENLTPDYKQPEGEMERFGVEHVKFYEHVETLDRQEQSKRPVKLRLEYQGSTKLHVDSLDDAEWFADFIEDGEIIYRTPKLKEGHWYMPTQKWWTDWQVKYYRNGQFHHEEHLSLMDQEVLVNFSSSSLGDTLSWMGQMVRYKDIMGIKKLFVRTHKNWLFDREWYKQKGIEIIDDWQAKKQYQVNIGVFYKKEEPWLRNEHKNDWRHQPLGKIATDILGIDYIEERPQMAPQFLKARAVKQKQIVIATASTAQAKYWNNPHGWQDLTQWHLDQGYKVLHASKEGGGPEGSEQLPEALDEVAAEINSAHYFVGISSGLSWFAWALGARVVLISGFTPEWIEFEKDCLRIINKDKCWGCWSFNTFDRGDWNWCPSHKGTARQFECTKQIEASEIITQIIEKGWV